MEPLHIVALQHFGCSREECMKAMAACKMVLLDEFSGTGIQPVLYEFSVKSRGDFSVLQEEPNSQTFTVLDGQPKEYSLEVMERALAERSDGPPLTRKWAFDTAVRALKTEDDSFVLSLEIMFEGEMSAPAYVVDVDQAGKYITPDHFYHGLKKSQVADFVASKTS